MNRSTITLIASLLLAPAAWGQTTLFSQAMVPNGGTLRPSQLWVDPSGQNDLDSDAIAWEDFTFAESSLVTHVEWWGQALPPLGFEVSFYNQDPNTIASQPDIFRPGAGPIAQDTYATPTVEGVSGGMFHFSIDLTQPIIFQGNTRYFVSVIALTPVPYATWGWAQGAGAGSTFYWNRGAHMFFSMPENRALLLSGSPAPVCPGDVNLDGSTTISDFNILANNFGTTVVPGTNGDLTGDGEVNIADFNILAGDFGCGA